MLKLERRYVDEIIAHARESAPNECCGIIAGENGRAVELFRAENSESSPYRYNVDSADLIRIFRACEERGWDFLAIYHSHVTSEAYPSRTDVQFASWPDACYLILSLRDGSELRGFYIRDGEIAEEKLEVI